ncbi:MAG TPA: hypothetical protein VGN26_23060 [Armatimonadota bacterium]|jgi:hypothetical protein
MRPSKSRVTAAVALVLLSAATGGWAQTFDAVGRGWFDATGSHIADNPNYVAGLSISGPGSEYRDFFVFDLSSLDLTGKTITDVRLELTVFSIYASVGGSVAYGTYDVSTPASDLMADQSGATGIFDDLGTGVSYGGFGLPSAISGSGEVTLDLTPAVEADLAAAAGGYFALGGKTQSVGPCFVFGGSGSLGSPPMGVQRLIVTTTPVPDGVPAGMALCALLPLGALLRRRRA